MKQFSMVYGSHEWILVQYENATVIHFFDCGEYREEFDKQFETIEQAKNYIKNWEK